MSGDRFITPPPFGTVGEYVSDLSAPLGSTLRIQWNASYANSSLWLIKDGDGLLCKELNLAATYCHAILPSIQNTNQYDWTVSSYDLAYNSSVPAYFLELRSNPLLSTGSVHIASHYFNILPAQGSSSIVSSSTSTSRTSSSTPTSSTVSGAVSTVTSSSPAAASSSTTSSASSSATTTPPSSDLSSGTKAAIGASVGIGVPLIAILLAILIVMTKRKKVRDRQIQPAQSSYIPPTYAGKPYANAEVTESSRSSVYPRQEMEVPSHPPQHQHQPSERWELSS